MSWVTTTSAEARDGIGLVLVAGVPVVDEVVLLVLLVIADDRGRGIQRPLCVHDGRERLVVDLDEFEGISCDVAGVGDHESHLLPLEAHLVGGQHGLRVVGQRRHPRQVEGLKHCAGDHRVHARQRFGRRGIDRADSRMGVRAAQDGAVQHARQVDVVDIVALPTQEAHVLLARHPTEAHRIAGWADGCLGGGGHAVTSLLSTELLSPELSPDSPPG